MQLTTKQRDPKWIVVSAYVGKKDTFKGLIFPTRYTYYRKQFATAMAGNLNRKIDKSRWPRLDFEFQVIPYEEIERG